MEAAAKLITALGTLLNAIAWPASFLILFIYFRKDVRHTLSKLPTVLMRLRKVKLAGLEAELDALADKASDSGEITADQARTAVGLAVEAKAIGHDHILAELDKLCLQIDTVRRTMRAGAPRTQEMSRIVVKMRALAPSVIDHVVAYKNSGSEGSRLAAITMMQMVPDIADIPWLLDRFRIEKPFSFYHAALALINAANSLTGQRRAEATQATKEALDIVQSFPGVPDQNTIDVLNDLDDNR